MRQTTNLKDSILVESCKSLMKRGQTLISDYKSHPVLMGRRRSVNVSKSAAIISADTTYLRFRSSLITNQGLTPVPLSDFGDAIVASVCRSQKGSFLVTFDRKFINALKKTDLAVASH